MVGKIYKVDILINFMEKNKIIEHLESEKKKLFNGFKNIDLIITEVAAQNIFRIKSITKIIRELNSKDIKVLLDDYQNEVNRLESNLSNEDIPIQPMFMEVIHRLKIMNDVLKLINEEDKINVKGYIG